MKLNIKFVICLTVFCIIKSSKSLIDWNGSSVCKLNRSQQVSRYVPYIETYRKRFLVFWKVATRYNYRWETHVEWYTDDVCCDGYYRDGNNCFPICDGKCLHGLCIAPQKCSCDIGYLLSDTSLTCKPDCSQGCINGFCSAPNTCSCFDRYQLSRDNVTCLPICKMECGAGSYCSEPDTCVCLKGYILKNNSNSSTFINKFECKPFCSKGCPENSSCLAPDICVCHDGFTNSMTTSALGSPVESCQPVCIPPCGKHSSCIAPNVCQCKSRYEHLETMANEFQCKPICQPPCGPNGICDSPDKCICNDNYQLKNTNNSSSLKNITDMCEPICNIPCGIRGDCVAPNVCSCKPGWKLVTLSLNEGKEDRYCAPHCDQPCPEFSVCTAPDLCECHYGYEKIANSSDDNSTICSPVCDKPCSNGTCTFPNVCTCNDDYKLIDPDDPFNCEPICGELGCFQGTCIAPGECLCNEGYKQSNFSSIICEPVCDDNCAGHGECIGPNDCQCDEGFIKENIKERYWSCVNPCNGQCPSHSFCNIENSTCECFYGWTGKNCGIPSLCGIIYRANDWDLPRWIVEVNDTVGNLEVVNWDGPICNKKCVLNSNDTKCFIHGSSNETRDGDTYVCLLDIGSMCNAVDLGSSNLIYSGIAGTIVLIITIAGSLGAILVMVKRRRNRDCTNPTDNLLEQSDPKDSLLQTDESSYL